MNNGGNGLINVGNTCYINAAIQAFLNISYVRSLISSAAPTHPLVYALHKLGYLLYVHGKALVRPKALVHVLTQHFGNLMNLREQNDSHEFFMILIDKLVEENKLLHATASASAFSVSAHKSLSDMANSCWVQEYGASVFASEFYGQLVQQVECGNCHRFSHRVETFLSISEIPSKFFKKELLKDYKCDKCSSICPSIKVVRIWRLPTIITITAKNFIPVEQLDLSEWFINTDIKNVVYNLKSIICHIGCTSSGHYFCLCYDDGKWYKKDDELVEQIHDISVYAASFCIFFYSQK